MTHDEAVNAALLAVSRLGHRAWRRDVGSFYDPRAIKTALGHLFSGRPGEAASILRRATLHKIGVPGEADVQGILIGGWALAIEIKTGAAQRREGQIKWARMFQAMGGCYILARWNDRENGAATLAKEIDRFLSERP